MLRYCEHPHVTLLRTGPRYVIAGGASAKPAGNDVTLLSKTVYLDRLVAWLNTRTLSR